MGGKTIAIIAVVAIIALGGGIAAAVLLNGSQGKTINSIEDLDGAKLAVQTGTTGDTFVTKNYEQTNKSEVYRYTTYPDAITDLKNKKVDAVIMDQCVAQAYVNRISGIKILDGKLSEDEDSYAFIFKKSNTSLRDEFNTELAKMFEDGTVAQINDYWNEHDDCMAEPYITHSRDTGRTIHVKTSPDFPPYDGLYDTKYTGIDMDIVREICYRLNYQVVFEQFDFDSIILAIQNGTDDDVGASGFSITPDREEKVLFSNLYASTEQVAVIRA